MFYVGKKPTREKLAKLLALGDDEIDTFPGEEKDEGIREFMEESEPAEIFSEEIKNDMIDDSLADGILRESTIINESSHLTPVEKQEIKHRFDGMRDKEREIFIHRVSTKELYSEIGRRIEKAEKFTEDIESIIDDYRRDPDE